MVFDKYEVVVFILFFSITDLECIDNSKYFLNLLLMAMINEVGNWALSTGPQISLLKTKTMRTDRWITPLWP